MINARLCVQIKYSTRPISCNIISMPHVAPAQRVSHLYSWCLKVSKGLTSGVVYMLGSWHIRFTKCINSPNPKIWPVSSFIDILVRNVYS